MLVVLLETISYISYFIFDLFIHLVTHVTCNALAALPLEMTGYALYRRLGGPQVQYGRLLKISPPIGIRFPDRQARSELLYRLNYSGPRTD